MVWQKKPKGHKCPDSRSSCKIANCSHARSHNFNMDCMLQVCQLSTHYSVEECQEINQEEEDEDVVQCA